MIVVHLLRFRRFALLPLTTQKEFYEHNDAYWYGCLRYRLCVCHADTGHDRRHRHQKFRVDAAVVQTMLETYFLCDREKHTAHVTGADKMSGSVYHHNVCDGRQPWTYWHSVRDLLIVDYYNATGSPARYADAVIDLETHTGLKPKYLAEHVDSLEKHNVIKASFEVQLMESIRSVVREKPRKVTDPH
jgi:hypothetical protein